MTIPVEEHDGPARRASTISGITGCLKPVGLNIGFNGESRRRRDSSMPDDSTYEFHIKAHKLAPRYYAVTAFDYGDPRSGLGPLATRPTANAVLLAPAGSAKEPVRAVPNPYRAYEDYTARHGGTGGISWENQNDGTTDFYSQARPPHRVHQSARPVPDPHLHGRPATLCRFCRTTSPATAASGPAPVPNAGI